MVKRLIFSIFHFYWYRRDKSYKQICDISWIFNNENTLGDEYFDPSRQYVLNIRTLLCQLKIKSETNSYPISYRIYNDSIKFDLIQDRFKIITYNSPSEYKSKIRNGKFAKITN